MKLGAQFVEKVVLDIEHNFNISFRLMFLILPKFHVFYVNFA